MKILILGAGQVGTTAAYSLAREEANEVTIVDRDSEVLRELQDRLDVRTVVGHAAHPEVLERAGAADADTHETARRFGPTGRSTKCCCTFCTAT